MLAIFRINSLLESPIEFYLFCYLDLTLATSCFYVATSKCKQYGTKGYVLKKPQQFMLCKQLYLPEWPNLRSTLRRYIEPGTTASLSICRGLDKVTGRDYINEQIAVRMGRGGLCHKTSEDLIHFFSSQY